MSLRLTAYIFKTTLIYVILIHNLSWYRSEHVNIRSSANIKQLCKISGAT